MIEQDEDPIASRIFKGNETRERVRAHRVSRHSDPRVGACGRNVHVLVYTCRRDEPSFRLFLSRTRASASRSFFHLRELPSHLSSVALSSASISRDF